MTEFGQSGEESRGEGEARGAGRPGDTTPIWGPPAAHGAGSGTDTGPVWAPPAGPGEPPAASRPGAGEVPPWAPATAAGAGEQPAWGPSAGGPGQPASGRRGRLRSTAALVVAAVLAAALGAGIVGIVEHHDAGGSAGGPRVSAAAAPAASTTGSVSAALAAIEPAIVDINTTIGGNGNGLFGGGGSGAGTGIIIGSNGEVVTNAHVVANATSIKVQIQGRSGAVNATVVGSDAAADLAVIKLQGVSGLPVATFAATSTVKVGDPVLAVGNAEGYGGDPTVTEGIISALNRSLPGDSNGSSLRGLLQTDAAINPGNSGGALVDLSGRVVGITTAVARGDRGASAQNIGFVIPSDTVLKALPALRAGRSVTPAPSTSATGGAFLGVGLADGNGNGALIATVDPGTPAAAAGIQAGDVIIAADGTKVTDATSLRAVIARHKPGDKISVTWQPGGQGAARTATVTLATRPATG